MSNHKHLVDLLKVCSILPALAIMPAMADDAILSGNAFVLGDVVTNETIYGGVRIVSKTPQQLAYPKYNMVARSFDLEDINNGDKVLFGPVNLTVRELESDEAFRWNSQRYDEDGNPIDFDLASYNDDGTEREVKVVWDNANGVEELGAMDRFLTRDDTKEAGVLNITNSDVIIAGSTVNADKICFSGANVNLVKELPGDTLKASDGKVKISADKLIVQDNSRILVGADTELDLTESEEILVQNNNADTDGGAIEVAVGASLNIMGGAFDNNSVYDANNMFGGAIWSYGKLGVEEASFSGNSATSGGAIGVSTQSTGTTIKNSVFTNNHALDGGAVSAFKSLSIENSRFENNTAMYARDDSGNWEDVATGIADPIGGGALALGAESEATISSIEGTTFKDNKSGMNGGAIGTRLANEVDNSWALTGVKHENSGKLDIAATFEDNYAERSGGAIYNTFYTDNGLDKGDGVTIAGVFDDNEAGYRGGAIYNDGDLDANEKGAVMTINGATFTDNEAGDSGGAIYNTGKLVINGGLFEDNESDGWAGAIYNSGSTDKKDLLMKDTEQRQTAGDLTIKNATFRNNKAALAGALAAGTSAQNTYIENTVFEGNEADEIGAVGLFSSATLNNVKFISNHAKETTVAYNIDGAGALFLGSNSATDVHGVLTGSVFDSNTSGINGGAIATRTFVQGDNRQATLDITGTMFKNNIAGTVGGAFDNYFYHSNANADAVYVADSSFVHNSATHGGAIYNHGAESAKDADSDTKKSQVASIEFKDTSFTGNIASGLGGAIYNETGAKVFLSGINTFTGNTANGVANDIHNLGTLTVASGTTTIGGGIAGNEGTLVLENGATLNIGTALIQQGTVNLDGAIVASAMNSTSFGRFAGDVTVGENATLDLTVGSVGTYDIFAGKTIDVSKVTVGDTYLVESGEDGIVITTKAVEDIAADTGLTTQAAGAIAGLANATDKNLQKVSLAAQQVLNSGDVAAVERETKKLNPTDKPVAQATAASVQNQVLSLTSGRMAGGVSVGRAGGDAVSKENGFWMQGLFNKSKLADEFNGYTRGFALGADLLIDNKWTIGGGLAVNDSDVRSNTADIDIDSKTVFLYGQYKPNNWFANATATYSMSEYTENKNPFGVMSGAAYDVESYGVQAMGGYDFATGITAEAGLRYLHIAQDAYTDDLGFKVKATDTDFLSGVAGLKYAFAIENDWKVRLRPELRAAMTYDFISDDIVATVAMPGVASYKVDVERLSRMGGEFGIGLTALYRGMEVSLMYDLDLHKDYTSQTGMIKFRGQF